MKLRLAAVSLSLAAAAAAVPAVASAATLATNKTCYAVTEPAVATGTGYFPNAPVNFTLDGSPFTSPTNPPIADGLGNVAASFTIGAPDPGRTQQAYVLGASDGVNSAAASFTVKAGDVGVSPKRGNPGKKKRIVAKNWRPGRNVFFHVRGQRTRNGKIGKPKRSCTRFTKRKRILAANWPSGSYTVQFDQSRRYSPNTIPRVVFTVSIFRTVRPAAAGAASASAGEVWTRVR